MLKRFNPLPLVCYLLVLLAWIVDLVTPQLFVAAILLNVPIALSAIALNGRLTASLVLLAEVLNVAAGYVNGVQSGSHWETAAIENRVLTAVSFILVGYLSTLAQRFAHEAGRNQERSRQVAQERRLRRAVNAVRETLNPDLVRRAIVRETLYLLPDSRKVLLVRQDTPSEEPERYSAESGLGYVQMERGPLEFAFKTVFSRIQGREVTPLRLENAEEAAVLADQSVRFGYVLPLHATTERIALFIFFDGPGDDTVAPLLETFGEGIDIALAQAALYEQLAVRNAEIDRQRGVIRNLVSGVSDELRQALEAENAAHDRALQGAYGPVSAAYLEMLETDVARNEKMRRLVESLSAAAPLAD